MGFTPLARLHKYCCWSLRRKVPDQSLPSISTPVRCGVGGNDVRGSASQVHRNAQSAREEASSMAAMPVMKKTFVQCILDVSLVHNFTP